MADARARAARKLLRELARGRPKDLEVVELDDGVVVFSWSEASLATAGLGPALADVLRGVYDGESNAEIAARRGTSVRTVENQVAALMRKLGATSRVDLARKSIAPPPPSRSQR